MEIKELINIKDIKIIKLSELKNHPLNPRKQTQQGMELLRKSVKKLGTFRPLIVNHKNEVLAGNQLLIILKEEGYNETSCLYPVRELTQEEEKQIIAMDNQNSFHKSANEFDIDIFANHFDEVLKDFELKEEEIDYKLAEEYINKQEEFQKLEGELELAKEKLEELHNNNIKNDNKQQKNDNSKSKIIIECNNEDTEEVKFFLETKLKETSFTNLTFK